MGGGGVCNHCERIMDGLRLDDVIAGNREGRWTEDEIVEYVQNGDPNHRDWDDWPLRMTFRINSFLRAHGPVAEPDLALLGFLDDKFNFNFFQAHIASYDITRNGSAHCNPGSFAPAFPS